MLNDPDLSAIIIWMPHGRSWKILNRQMFSGFALPRYFGHSNYASFVRIVNAWGFRRISKGIDRDTYYHELFLRSKPQLHDRMKRLPSCHRKTPVDKEDTCPDFYELSKNSPLPDVSWTPRGQAVGGVLPTPAVPASGGAFPQLNPTNAMAGGAFHMPGATKPVQFGDSAGGFSAMGGLMGGGGLGTGGSVAGSSYGMMDNNPMLSLLGMSNPGGASMGS